MSFIDELKTDELKTLEYMEKYFECISKDPSYNTKEKELAIKAKELCSKYIYFIEHKD